MNAPVEEAPTRAGLQRTFQALSHPTFRRLWIAGWLWYSNLWIEFIVLSWLMLDLTNSPMQVALVGVTRMGPMFFFGILGGSLSDRFPKHHVLFTIQCVNILVTLTMALILISGIIRPWHIFVVSFLMGTSWTIDFSARRSYFAAMFPPNRLVNAISLDAAAMTGSGILGPILGGTLIALTDYHGAYIFMVILFLIGFTLLFPIPSRQANAPRSAFANPLTQIAEAFQLIRTNRAVWAAFSVTVAMNFFGFPYFQMVPVIARDVLDANAVFYSILSAAAGTGSFIGAMVIATRGSSRQGTLYSVGSIIMLVSVFAFAFSNLYGLSLLLLFIAGLGMAGFATMQPVLMLQATPPEMSGRAMGIIAIGIGASPLGMFVVGLLAEFFGAPTAIAISTGMGIIVLVALRILLEQLRD